MATEVNELKRFAEQAASEFTPYSELNEELDSLTVYLKPDADYSKRLSDHVTLFLSLETDEIVGCRVKGISEIVRDLPNYVTVNHEGVQLSFIFLSFRGSASTEDERKAINKLAREVSQRKMALQTD